MTDLDPDSVYRVKKNIGYAKFFLKVGKRSDAQERLRKALFFIEESSRGMTTATSETHQLMDLTEEVYALWEESKDTPDPPGSSFLIAMGDMVYLATPGGGMTVVDLDPENKSDDMDKSTSTPETPPEVPVNPGGKETPTGFFGRFNPFGRGGNNNDEETKEEEEKQPLSLGFKDLASVALTGAQRKNRKDSMIIVDGKTPVKNPIDLSYTLVHIGTDESQRQGVFFEALRNLKREGTGSQSNIGNDLPYYSQYFENACARPKNEQSVSTDHPGRFVRHVLGEKTQGDDHVEEFNLMVLETAPSTNKIVNNAVYQVNSRKVVSFAFMKLDEDLSSMHVELVCHAKKDEKDTLGGGKGMMTKIESIARLYGINTVSLNSVIPVVGFYYKAGYETPTKGFNIVMNEVFSMEKQERGTMGSYDTSFNKRVSIVLQEENDIMKAAIEHVKNTSYLRESSARVYVEIDQKDVYKRHLVVDILDSMHVKGWLVHTLVGFLNVDNNSSADGLETKLRELITSIASEIDSNTYTIDQNGRPEINMSKYLF